MPCPLPAHPRQMDFSFMLLPPLPPSIFPSLPLRHLHTPLIPAMIFTIRYQPSSSAVCLFHIFVIIVVKSPHQFLSIGGWAPSHSPPHCLPPLCAPSLFAPPFPTASKWHTIIWRLLFFQLWAVVIIIVVSPSWWHPWWDRCFVTLRSPRCLPPLPKPPPLASPSPGTSFPLG